MPDRPSPAPDEPARAPGASGPSGAPSDLPASLGRYKVLRELGRGGMGVVLLARDSRLERDIAIQLLPGELALNETARTRFLAEARALAALNHPNIATIHSLEEAAGRHFVTMELVEGRSLQERRGAGALTLDETLSIVRQVVRGLEAAHASGVVHGDLKPSNVMLRPDGTAKVLDFGLAVRLEPADGDASAAGSGEIAGSPGYMSPEQVRGEPGEPRTDVWAVGCLLYECLSGRPLIAGAGVAERLAATLALDPSRIRVEAPDATPWPPRLVTILERCLAAQAGDRFGSMREVRLLLEEEIAERALPAAAPAMAALPASPGNLPRRLTSFVGRAEDLASTARLLGEHRLLTLTGAGGCGKTRLALESAEQRQRAYADGAWMVELAPLADPALVPASVAAALGVNPAPGTPVLPAVLEHLSRKRLLLLLDNCEHVLEACAELAASVLGACPDVRILATSREPLRVPGETVVAVAPLGLPGGASSSAMSSAYPTPTPRPSGTGAASARAAAPEPDADAVLLFAARARAVHPGFVVDDTNRAAVHEICRRLDGIPLAIELAAARARVLGVGRIRDLLHDRFRLLTRGALGAQPHQSTLRALIDWSYDRLEPQEQAVLRRLSVFRGAWSLDAVEAVAAGGGVEPGDVLDLFTRLVEKSLVVRDMAAHGAGSARYHLYESIRAYADEKLREQADERARTAERLRDYIVALAAEGDLGLRSREQAQWGARLADALDDVRAVLEQAALDPHGAETGLRVAGNYWLAWMNRGMWKECADAITRALAHPGANTASAPYGKALVVAGNVAYRLGELDRARELYERARRVLMAVGTPLAIGIVHMNLGNIALGHAEHDEAHRLYETALAYFRKANETVWIAGCLNNLSVLALAREDIEQLEALQSETLLIHEAAGIRESICLSLLQLGIAAFVREDFVLARERWERGLRLARELENQWIIMATESNIAAMEVGLGRRAEARELLRDCVQRLHDMPDPAVSLPLLETTARLYLDAAPERAARLFAAAHALRAALQTPLLPYERRMMDAFEAVLTARLGEAARERERAAGGKLTMAAALADAGAMLETEL